ncbi:MAG: hypothetical protein IH576_00660 [Deltaproteobacteria bacterium]|nr:hypothetical protein [Deltaproteobacteria bacterium]
MDFAGGVRRKGLRGAAAFLGLAFLLGGAACGKKEGSAPPGSPGGVAGVSLPASGGSVPPAVGVRVAVVVDPILPSRIVPPGVSVKSSPGRGGEVLEVRWIVNGMEREKGLRLPSAQFRRGDRIQAVVTVRAGGEEKVVTTTEVLAVNSPPVASSVRIEPVAPVSGDTVRAIVAARDADDDPLTIRYQWFVDNVSVSGDTDRLELKEVKRGAWIHVKAIPNDGSVDGAWCESSRHQVVNGLPVVKSDVPKEVPPGRNFVYRIVAVDPDGDPLAYSLKKGPPGMVLKEATLEWEVPEGYLGQPVDIAVEITDGQDGRTVQNISITVQPPGKNR